MTTTEQEQEQDQPQQEQPNELVNHAQNEWKSSVAGANRIYEVTEGIRSPQTKVVYQRAFNSFLNHIKIHDLQILLDYSRNRPQIIKEMIVDYVLYLRDERKIICGSIKVHLAAILHFFQINNDDFNLTIRSFRFHLPSDDSTNDDRPYTVEEIAQVLQKGCDIRSKVVILLLCSSGMRMGALPLMQIGDLTPVKWHDFDLYKIQVYARTRDKYYTFTTLETTKAIRDYLDFRRRCKEQLSDKSPLIREQFNRDNPFTTASPKFVSKKGIEYLIDNVLKRSGVRNHRVVHMSHGYRKFFVSQCESSPMKSVHVSMLAGHDIGIKKPYYMPKESVVLEDFMSNAVDALTILPENRLMKQLELTEERHSREYEDIRRMYKQLEEQAIETRKWLNKKLRPRGLKAFNGNLVDINANEEDLISEYELRKRATDNNNISEENPHVGL